MNKIQMEEYLSRVSFNAYNQGVEAMSRKIAKGLKKTKGIGEKRIEEAIINISTESSDVIIESVNCE